MVNIGSLSKSYLSGTLRKVLGRRRSRGSRLGSRPEYLEAETEVLSQIRD